jgi:hypothetical protein
MSYYSFQKLLAMLQPSLMVNTWKSHVQTNTKLIYTEIILHCTLQFLAGGSYLDIMCNAVLSHTAFYSSIYKGIDLINRCPDLALKLPRSLEELHNAADEFASLSRDWLLNGCVLVLDGWLCWIKVPGSNETPNVSSYFSGHYQVYGLNVQATCDVQSRFTYVCFLCPGGSVDSRAYQERRKMMNPRMFVTFIFLNSR